MKSSNTCLVTGGAGFIGSHLCEVLLKGSFEVFCVDNLITGSKQNIAHLTANPHFHFIEHDITQPIPAVLSSQFSVLGFVYHLASPASPPKYQKYSIETLHVNSVGTYMMLELAKEKHAKFLLASTSEVYGDPLEHPQKETYYGNVNPVGIRACYDEGKRFAEALTMEFVRKHQVDARIIRIFNTYGPRMDANDGRVISNFVTQALTGKPLTLYGDGSQTRSFCFVSDLVTGIIGVMENENTQGEVINLGYPEEHTIQEIAQLVLKLTGSPSKVITKPLPQDDPKKRLPDITRAKTLLGWEPKVSLEEGLKETIEYFKKS